MAAAKKTQGATKRPVREGKAAAAAVPPIGVEPVVRVGGHVATEDGWVPEEAEE